MITEDYVSSETAKLLKEKGFDGNCYKVWAKDTKSEPKLIAAPHFVEGYTVVNKELVEDGERYMNSLNPSEDRIEGYLAPTLQMVVKWLRVVYNINLSVVPHSYKDGKPFDYEFVYWHGEEYHTPYDEKHPAYHELFGKTWKKYEEACDAAIKYCLENLIQI